MIRQIKLRNENNEIYDLLTDTFLRSPKGLGMQFITSFNSYNLVRRVAERKLAFEQFQGELVFKSYGEYQNFINYVMKSKKLILMYNPNGAEYYVPVQINNIDKSEKDKITGLLICMVVFDLMGYWKKEDVFYSGVFEEVPTNPVYPFTYPLTYGVGSLNSEYISVYLDNNGHSPAPLLIKITGRNEFINWSIEEQKGELQLLVSSGQVVEVDSREEEMKIFTGQTILDQYKNQLMQNYIYAPIGESVLLIGGADEVEVVMYEQFASV